MYNTEKSDNGLDYTPAEFHLQSADRNNHWRIHPKTATGTWAVFPCIGPMPDSIQNLWKRIYSEWLPTSEYELVPGFDAEMYTEGDVGNADYKSEVWLSVKKK